MNASIANFLVVLSKACRDFKGNICFLTIALMALTLVLPTTLLASYTEKAVADDEAVQTIAGRLTLHNADGPLWRVNLNDKTIHQSENRYLSFKTKYVGPAHELVLLMEGLGGTACPALFRLIRLNKDGTYAITEEFGDCNDLPAIEIVGETIRFYFVRDTVTYTAGKIISTAEMFGKDAVIIKDVEISGELQYASMKYSPANSNPYIVNKLMLA